MSATLYLYVENKIDDFIRDFDDYQIYDISYFLSEYQKVDQFDQIDYVDYGNIIIDLSNIAIDANISKIYIELLIAKLQEFENVIFCMKASLLNVYRERFPFLARKHKVNCEYSQVFGDESESTYTTIVSKVNIYTYLNISDIRVQSDSIIVSLPDLIESWDSFSIKYKIETVKSLIIDNRIQYIDITSMVNTLRVRQDLIFQFEILVYTIIKSCDVKFCINATVVDELDKVFPLLFSDKVRFDTDVDTTNECTEVNCVDIGEINSQVEAISQQLKGHYDFKSDFKSNLLKYRFLNYMGERKIFSIMLCGESGVGKTEFAKMLSKTLYPVEELIKINFGNYSNEGVLNSLIGSPLGYVGSEEGGELINKINNSKSKVILIDEFEKATPSVYNFFYELLEDGKFTDRHGKSHDLNGYIIVFTSNMLEENYIKNIPDSLKSRFDMVYRFVDVPNDDKKKFIDDTSSVLINKLSEQFHIQIDKDAIQKRLYKLLDLHNLRDIKRKIEDIVFEEFFHKYEMKVDYCD